MSVKEFLEKGSSEQRSLNKRKREQGKSEQGRLTKKKNWAIKNICTTKVTGISKQKGSISKIVINKTLKIIT